MGLQNFVRELKNRGAYRVAALYAAAAWALLQVADVIFPVLGLPDRAITFLLVTAAALFPVAVISAWFLDWTRAGIRLTSAEEQPVPAAAPRTRMVEMVVLVFLVGLVGYLYWERLTLAETENPGPVEHQPSSEGNSAPFKSIAVLPFVTLSDRVEDSYFGDGLAEEILNLLSGLRELQVAARNSSFALNGQTADLGEMARKLNVRHILKGSVRRMDEQIRVTAQLIDASTGYHLWSDTYNRRFEDIFRIQDDIARQVTSALQLILSREASEQLRSRPTANLESYDYYLQAKYYLRRPPENITLDSALSLLQRSIELDPEFANARAATCDAYLLYYQLKRSSEFYKEAERACYAALVLDDGDAEVYSALGNLYLKSGQSELAAVQFRRSLTLDPDSTDAQLGLADVYMLEGDYELAENALLELRASKPSVWLVHVRLGNFLHKTGRARESIAAYEAAIELSPDNQAAYNGLGVAWFMLGDFKLSAEAWSKSLSLAPSAMTYSNTGSSFLYMGDYRQAADMYRKAVELAPRDYEHWGNLGQALFAANRHEEAVAVYLKAIKLAEESLDINAENPDTTALLAHYYAAAGRAVEAEKLAERALQLAPNSMYGHYDVAIAYARLGKDDRAVEVIQRAIELGYPPELIAIDPGFSRLKERILDGQLE